MEAILAAALGNLPSLSYSSILPTITQMVDYAPSAMEALSSLSQLVTSAGGIGDAFKSMYNQLFGKSFESEVLTVYSGVETQPPQQTIAACTSLSEEIKAAIAAVNAAPPPVALPRVCNLETKEFQSCGPEFIAETKSKLEMLNSELEIAQCKLKGIGLMKLLQQQKLETCSYALKTTDATCKAQTGACPGALPPPPIPEPPVMVCGLKRKKKTCNKKKKKVVKKPAPKCNLRQPIDDFLIDALKDNDMHDNAYGLRYF